MSLVQRTDRFPLTAGPSPVLAQVLPQEDHPRWAQPQLLVC